MIKRTKVRNANKRKKNRRVTKKGGVLPFRINPEEDLFDAIYENDLKKVEAWGKKTTRDVNLFKNYNNPLTCAISLKFSDEKNLNIIKNLVEIKKANINTMGRSCDNNDNNVKYTPLMFSIKHKKINVMEFLLEKGAAVDRVDNNDNNTIFTFAYDKLAYDKRNSNIVNEIVKALLENIKLKNCTKELLQNIDQQTYDSQKNALLENTSYSYILSNIINYPNKFGKTALMYACENGNSEIVNKLLEKGAAVDKLDNDNNTIFNLACNKGNLEIVKALLENIKLKNCTKELLQNIDQQTYDSQKNTLLENTSYSYILSNIINYPNKFGKTALMYACENGNSEIVNKLLEKGAAVDKLDNDNNTIFNLACNKGNLEIVKALLENIKLKNCTKELLQNIDQQTYDSQKNTLLENTSYSYILNNIINYPNKLGRTALMHACKNGNSEIVNKLLEKGAAVDKLDNDNNTIFNFACNNGNLEIVNSLLEKISSYNANNITNFINYPNKSGNTALIYACKNGNSEIVNKLLEKGAIVNLDCNDIFNKLLITDNLLYCKTALMYACENGNLDIVNALLNKNADVNAYNKTALMYACENGKLDIVNALLNKNADVNVNVYNKTALMYACEKGNSEIVNKLLEKGANVNAYNKTALMYACEKEKLDIVNALLNKNVDVNVNVYNKTALMYACENGNLDIVNALLNKDADPKACGKTALTYACENKYIKGISDLLKKNKTGSKACGHDKDLIDPPLMIAFTKGKDDIIKALSTKINDDSYFKKVKKYYDDSIRSYDRNMFVLGIVGTVEDFLKNGSNGSNGSIDIV